MSGEPIGVVVADDHPIVLDGLLALIQDAEGLELRASASRGDEAVRLAIEHRPGVVLLDVRMPGCDGIEATRRILEAHSEANVIVLSAEGDSSLAVESLRAGAIGFLSKETPAAELLEAIRSAAAGRAVLSTDLMTEVLAEMQSPSNPEPVTREERELAMLVSVGKTNTQIASELGISLGSVKARLSALFLKLGATDRASAVATCLRRGSIR